MLYFLNILSMNFQEQLRYDILKVMKERARGTKATVLSTTETTKTAVE